MPQNSLHLAAGIKLPSHCWAGGTCLPSPAGKDASIDVKEDSSTRAAPPWEPAAPAHSQKKQRKHHDIFLGESPSFSPPHTWVLWQSLVPHQADGLTNAWHGWVSSSCFGPGDVLGCQSSSAAASTGMQLLGESRWLWMHRLLGSKMFFPTLPLPPPLTRHYLIAPDSISV